MAILDGLPPYPGIRSLSIRPLPVAGADAHEYLVEIDTGKDGGLVSRIFSVAGWQMGHDDVWALARAFSEARAVEDASLSVDLWRTGNNQHASLYASAHWLQVVMWGKSKLKRFAVRLFLQAPADPDHFTTYHLTASLDKLVEFGDLLEQEIISASPGWASERGFRKPEVDAP